ncbi:MAG TPA: DUF935 family protein, partial [Candidatus Omnitrophota bacterium]|nr:DUF935 family protein [Candidatus Omnitrophota bacterium]
FFVPAEVAPKDQRRFVFDDDARLRLLTWESPLFGEELPERKFLVHRFGDKTGDPYGRGLGHQLFWWVYFKRMVMQFWLVFAEKFGSPTVAGEYPNTMLPADQDKLLATLSNLAQQGALIMPEGTKAYLLEALRSGTVTYPELVEYCDRMITLAVLGNTLTTSEGNAGSRALGQVHAGVEETIVDADADMLSGTLNAQLMAWITWLNYPGAKPPRVWRPRPTEETAEEKLLQERIKTLDMAVRHVDSRRRSGWEPTDPTLPLIDQVTGDWIYTGKATSVLADGRETMPKDPPAELAAPDRRRDGVDDLVDQVHEAAAPAMDLLVDQVRTIIAEADSLDQVADLLLARYAEIDDTALADVMRQALELGALTGAADAGNP